MKGFKIFSMVAVAALLLTPATAMAKTSFNISFNVFDCLSVLAPRPVFVAPLPPPPRVFVPCPHPVPYYRQPIVVHHYYHPCPPPAPYPYYPHR